MKVSITWEDKGVNKHLKSMRERIDREVSSEIAQATRDTSRSAKSFAPVNLGGLKSSIRAKVSEMDGEVIAGAKYAPYVEFGTGSKAQVPQELQDDAMQFKGAGIREVNTRAQPYLYPAFFTNRARIKERFKRLLKDLTK